MKKKILYILSAVVVIIGIVLTAVLGLNKGLQYSNAKRLDVNLDQEFNNSEIKSLVKDVIGKKAVSIQKIEIYGDMVSITVKDLNEEQKNAIVSKLSEKYGKEFKDEDVTVSDANEINTVKIFEPYFVPVALTVLAVTLYQLIRYRSFKVIGKSLYIMIMPTALVYSVLYAIARIEVNRYTVPVLLLVFIASLIASEYSIKVFKTDKKETETNK